MPSVTSKFRRDKFPTDFSVGVRVEVVAVLTMLKTLGFCSSCRLQAQQNGRVA